MQTKPSPQNDNKRITEALKASLPPDVTKALTGGLRPGRPLKPTFRHVINFDWFREFTLLERLKILIGYNLDVAIRIPTLHKPGELGVLVIGEATKDVSAKENLRARAKLALQEMYGDQLPIEHERQDKNPVV